MLSGMNVGYEGLDPVGAVADRAVEHDRQHGRRKLIAVKVALDPIGTAAILCNHPNIALRYAKVF